jgi:hypothetical protein
VKKIRFRCAVPHLATRKRPPSPTGDAFFESGEKRRAQFCKARMRVRDAAEDCGCQTARIPTPPAIARHRFDFPQQKFLL